MCSFGVVTGRPVCTFLGRSKAGRPVLDGCEDAYVFAFLLVTRLNATPMTATISRIATRD